MQSKSLLKGIFVSFSLILAAESALAKEVYFRKIRNEVKKVTPHSEQDYLLGQKLLKEIRIMAKTRKRALPKPILMAESLSAAGRMYVTDHLYSDRQLFAARDMWSPESSQFKVISHKKTFELMEKSGFDSCTSFLYGERGGRYLETFPAVKPNITFIPNLVPAGLEGKLDKNMLRKAAKCPHTLMINGKMVVASYSSLDVPGTEKFIKTVEKMAGIPISFLYNHGTLRGLPDPFESYAINNKVSAFLLLKWFDFLTDILKTADGIEYSNRLTEKDGTLCARYYDEVVLPLFAAVCAQKNYNGKKYFCLQAAWGYNNFSAKQRLSHNGTKTIRSFMELAAKHKVDFIKAFEWDEYNEDTHFQPTVNKPMAMMRLLSYLANVRLKGGKPTPFKGDDLSLPNMIISQRKEIAAGPDFELELLQVPDSEKMDPIKATLEVLNEEGKLVKRSPLLTFKRGELKEYTLRIPADNYINSYLLRPRLTVEYQGKKRIIEEGLPFTKVSLTETPQKTWFSTPLRNILFPVKSNVQFGKVASLGKGTLPERIHLPVSAALSFKEALNSVEVVQNGRDNRYAYDPHNEFLQNDPSRVNLLFSAFRLENGPHIRFQGKVEIKNAPSAVWFAPPPDPKYKWLSLPHVKQKIYKASEKKDITLRMLSSWLHARLYSLKKSEMDKAVFSIRGKILRGPGKGSEIAWELPLKELAGSGIKNEILPFNLQFALEIPQRMNILPLPLNRKEVQFKTKLYTGYPNGVFAVRAVSRSGKVYWSKPHIVKAPVKGKLGTIVNYHDDKGPQIRKVDSGRIPHIKYRFEPSIAGKLLTTEEGRQFYGNAGGYPSIGTGYEGLMCALFSIPRSFRHFRKTDGTQPCSPNWVREKDGKWSLDFTGKGEFIIFPPTVFPQRCGYTVKMEFFPRQVWKDQVYFTHEETSKINGFRVRTEDERLVIDFYRRQAKGLPRESTTLFKTNLTPLGNKWNTLTFQWDIKSVKITLNGKSESFATTGIGCFIACGGFGGAGSRSKNGTQQYFNGKLRSFEVYHGVDLP